MGSAHPPARHASAAIPALVNIGNRCRSSIAPWRAEQAKGIPRERGTPQPREWPVLAVAERGTMKLWIQGHQALHVLKIV